MRARSPTPPAGSARILGPLGSQSLSRPVIMLHAKSHHALMSATARQVATLQDTPHSETVLVVYGANNAASVFCEHPSLPVRAGLPR